jgi:hypothetical protein
MVEGADIEELRTAGWEEQAIWEVIALISFFNPSGRLEVASGFPSDEIPEGARSVMGLSEAHLQGRDT